MSVSSIVRHSSFMSHPSFPSLQVTVNHCDQGQLKIQEDLCLSIVSSDGSCIVLPFVIENPVRNDNTIVFPTGLSLSFTDTTACSIAWIAICTIASNEIEEMLPPPSLDQIPFLSMYLRSVHPIMYPLISKSIVRIGFLHSFYEVFVVAELGQRFDVLPLFREIVLSFFHLQSAAVLSLLLESNHINHTISCLEYDTHKPEYHTTHRNYLNHTNLHCVMNEHHEQIKHLAQTNYRINYIKNVILYSYLPYSILTDIDNIITKNNCTIIQILLNDKRVGDKIIRSIVPIMIAFEGKLISYANPDENGLRFLKELLSLTLPESAIRRLLRRLCAAHLFELLDHVFITTNMDSPLQSIVLDIWNKLYHIASDKVAEYIYSPNSKILSTITTHLLDNSDVSLTTDHMIDFLLAIVPEYQPIPASSHYETEISLSKIIKSLFSIHDKYNIRKQQKICEFLIKLFNKRPDLCQENIHKCITAFMGWVDYSMTEKTLSSQQKLLRLDTSRLLCESIVMLDHKLFTSVCKRTGFAESIILMMLLNGSQQNMLNTSIQRMICSSTEKWISSLFTLHPKLERLTPAERTNALHQIIFSLSSAVANISNEWDKKETVIPTNTHLVRCDSLQNIQIMPNFSRQLAIQKMSTHVLTKIRQDQLRALSRWKRFIARPEPGTNAFLMDAIYALASNREKDRCCAMKFALRKSVLPIIRKAVIRKSFQEWKYVIEQERNKAKELQKHIVHWKDELDHTIEESPNSYRSIDSRSSIGDNIDYATHLMDARRYSRFNMKRLPTSTSIGEEIGTLMKDRKSDDDTFFFIRAIKNDGSYLLTNTNITFNK